MIFSASSTRCSALSCDTSSAVKRRSRGRLRCLPSCRRRVFHRLRQQPVQRRSRSHDPGRNRAHATTAKKAAPARTRPGECRHSRERATDGGPSAPRARAQRTRRGRRAGRPPLGGGNPATRAPPPAPPPTTPPRAPNGTPPPLSPSPDRPSRPRAGPAAHRPRPPARPSSELPPRHLAPLAPPHTHEPPRLRQNHCSCEDVDSPPARTHATRARCHPPSACADCHARAGSQEGKTGCADCDSHHRSRTHPLPPASTPSMPLCPPQRTPPDHSADPPACGNKATPPRGQPTRLAISQVLCLRRAAGPPKTEAEPAPARPPPPPRPPARPPPPTQLSILGVLSAARGTLAPAPAAATGLAARARQSPGDPHLMPRRMNLARVPGPEPQREMRIMADKSPPAYAGRRLIAAAPKPQHRPPRNGCRLPRTGPARCRPAA